MIRSRARRLALLASSLIVAATLSGPSLAQLEPDELSAKKQFEEGLSALEEGDLPRARELLRASLKAVPKANTFFNLADCEERMGLYATAAAHYEDGLALLDPKDDRRPTFDKRIAALGSKIPRIRIELAEGSPEGTRVLLEGKDLPPEKLGTEIPFDPGTYRVTVRAPGRLDKLYSVELVKGRTELVSAKAGERLGPPPGTLRTIGFALTGAGALGLGAWGVTGALALQKRDELGRLCPDVSRCGIQGEQRAREGADLATASTLAFALGLTTALAGVTLVIVADRLKPVAVSAAAGPTGGLVQAHYVF